MASTPILRLSESGPIHGAALTYGHFTSIHPGHIRYLKQARQQGKSLLVAVIGDIPGPNGTPAYRFSQEDRAEGLALLNIADRIVLLEGEELAEAILRLEPHALVLGTEQQRSRHKPILRAVEVMRQQGRQVLFHAGETHYANANLLRDTESDLAASRLTQFRRACERQGLNRALLEEQLQAWKQVRLVVVGDTIVDQYTACEAVGMSAEAPVVVVRELEDRVYIGAAAVVASHVSALGAHCDLVSVVGNDQPGALVRRELAKRGIEDGLVSDGSRPTTFKKRYLVDNQKLFRVSRMEEHDLFPEVEDQLIAKLEKAAAGADGLIVSDFVYGVVTERVLGVIRGLSQRHGLKLFGDLQCSSQVGSITRFENFSLLSPNEREARVALQDKDSGLEALANQLIATTGCERLLMKLSAEGFIAYDRDEKGRLFSEHFPALSVNPLDVTGAGDSLLAVMAVGLSAGKPMMATAALGCCMAALAVETMGNEPIGTDRLSRQLDDMNLS